MQSLLNIWLDLPTWGILLALGALLGTSQAAIWGGTAAQRSRARVLSFTGVVAPFFSALAILFALLTSFLANDAWERHRQANRAVLSERDGLFAAHNLSAGAGAEADRMRELIRTYIRSVVMDEWPRMARQEHAPTAGQALGALQREAAGPELGQRVGPAVQAALLEAVQKLRTARYDRLSISSNRSDATKWASVLILALLTQASIGAVHLERPRAQLLALLLFTLGAVTALGLVAVRERPFDGPMPISPAPLQEVLAIIQG